MNSVAERVPGDVIDRRLVAEGPGGRTEWHLVVQEDGSDQWHPRYIDADDKVEEPVWLPLPATSTPM